MYSPQLGIHVNHVYLRPYTFGSSKTVPLFFVNAAATVLLGFFSLCPITINLYLVICCLCLGTPVQLPSVLLLHKVRHFCLRQQVDDWKSGHGMVMEHSASCKIRAAVEHDRHFCSMNLEACEARQQASRPYAERPWWVDNGPKSHDT